jgi:hypothetical protein
MMRIIIVILVLTTALISLNNSKVNPNDPSNLEDSERPIDPNTIPKNKVIYKFVPIATLEFRVTPWGIDLIKKTRRMGIKSHSLTLDREIKISALNGFSEVVKTYAVNDPRHIHSMDGKQDQHVHKDIKSSVFRVNIEQPEKVRYVKVEANTETLVKYEKVFEL